MAKAKGQTTDNAAQTATGQAAASQEANMDEHQRQAAETAAAQADTQKNAQASAAVSEGNEGADTDTQVQTALNHQAHQARYKAALRDLLGLEPDQVFAWGHKGSVLTVTTNDGRKLRANMPEA